jgi:L-ascorbate metabolism protein UlaG (beta-lactamase superfamily)
MCLHAVEGHLISGYQDGGDDPDKQRAKLPIGDYPKVIQYPSREGAAYAAVFRVFVAHATAYTVGSVRYWPLPLLLADETLDQPAGKVSVQDSATALSSLSKRIPRCLIPCASSPLLRSSN